jgi:hypothetical protein
LLFCGLGFLVSDDVFAYTGARFHGLGKVTHFRKVTLAYCAQGVSPGLDRPTVGILPDAETPHGLVLAVVENKHARLPSGMILSANVSTSFGMNLSRVTTG